MPTKDEMLANPHMIDLEIFGQLVELDDGEEDEEEDEEAEGFLEGLITVWYDQADTSFKEMDDLLKEKELDKFSKAAHFLKGSSAQLGITSLQHTCTTLQHYGEQWDDKKDTDRTKNLSEDEAMKLIPPILSKAKQEYKEARKWMELYLADDPKEKLELPKVEALEVVEEKTPGKKPADTPNGVRRSSIPAAAVKP